MSDTVQTRADTGQAWWARLQGAGLMRTLPWVGVVMGYACLLAAVYHRLWWSPPGERLFFGWDCTRVYWQDLVFVMNALADGELPLWNPFMAMGYSFHSEPQTGLYSPMNWLLYAVGLVSGSRGPWLIQAKVLLTFWLGMVGMHLWIHRRHGSHLVATFAAIVFGLGSPLLVFKNSSLAWPLLMLPWALIAQERLVSGPSLRRGAVFALTLWLCGSAGSPQGFFFCILLLVPLHLFHTAALGIRQSAETTGDLRLRTTLFGRALLGQLPSLGLALLLTALLLAPVYVPAWLAMPHTPRESRSLAFLLAQPQTWASLEELLLSQRDRNWFLDLYMGALTIPLAVFGLVSATRQSAPRCLLWLGLASAGVFLSLGEHTSILPWLVEKVPGFDLFRIPYRYKLFFFVGLVALAAEGLGALLLRRLSLWQRLAWLALGAAWIWYAALAASGRLDPKTPPAVTAAREHLTLLAPAFLLLALPAWLRVPSWFGRPAWPLLARWALVPGALALGLGAADLWRAGREKILIMERPPWQERDALLYGRLPGLSSREHRIYQHPTRLSAMNNRVRELGGYLTFPMRISAFDDLIRQGAHDWALLGRFNVRWIHAALPRHQAHRLPAFAHRRSWNLVELKSPAPLLELFPGYEVVPAGQALTRMRRPGAPLCALLEPEAARALRAAGGQPPPACSEARKPHGEPGSEVSSIPGKLLSYRRNRLLFEVSSESGGIAVINEPFFPGWLALLDGRPAPLVRANHMLRAVQVPPGTHRLELRYRPRAYPWLLAGFLAGLIALSLLLSGLATRIWKARKAVGLGKKPRDVREPRTRAAP